MASSFSYYTGELTHSTVKALLSNICNNFTLLYLIDGYEIVCSRFLIKLNGL